MQTIKKPLRICRDCGLEAYTKEDLELFKRDNRSCYNRQNLCKVCSNEYEKTWNRTNPEKYKINYTRRNSKLIGFQRKIIRLKKNPRTDTCSKCGKSYPEELKRRTAMHHEFYDLDNPLNGTVELCASCHAKCYKKREV